MNYFRLSPDCFLVEGKQDAVLYDVSRQRLFALDPRAYEVVRRSEANEPLDGWLEPGGRALLERLEAAGLGTFDQAPAFVDKLLLNAPLEWKGFLLQAPRYSRCDWTVSDRCDMRCEFCPGDGRALAWQACQTCVRKPRGDGRSWFPEDVDAFVDEVAGLGVEVLHLRGGDPLLEWERTTRILRAAARHAALRVIITTPGTGAEPAQVVELCREFGALPNVVFFGHEPGAAAETAGDGGACRAQIALIDALRDAEALFFATILLGRETAREREAVLDFAEARWGGRPSVAEIHAPPEPGAALRLSHVASDRKRLTPWRSIEQFFFRLRKNSCLEGNFEIGFDGRIRPCASLDTLCGDLGREGLRAALASDTLYDLWALDKSQIEPCKGCALRFACSDCTAMELAGAADPLAKSAYCSFDPGGSERVSERTWEPAGFVQRFALEEVPRS